MVVISSKSDDPLAFGTGDVDRVTLIRLKKNKNTKMANCQKLMGQMGSGHPGMERGMLLAYGGKKKNLRPPL